MKTRVLLSVISVLVLITACGTPAEQEATGRFETKYIYSDGTDLYRNPQEPGFDEAVTIKIRTLRNNVDEVVLYYGTESSTMRKLQSEGDFDYFFGEIPPQDSPIGYYFEVSQGNKSVYYSRRGLELRPPTNSLQFKLIPGFTVPNWMRGAVLYQIFIDRFHNGDPTNDVLTNEYMYDNWPSVRIEDWDQYPDSTVPYAEGGNRTREFYGGDIEGVIQKLDYLAELGVDGIYFNPLFVAPSNHKYDTQDYEYVDPHLGVIVTDEGELINPEDDPFYEVGTFGNRSEINQDASRYITRTTSLENLEASNDKLRELIEEAHERGIRVILDGVFNHSGSFNKWLDREGIYPDEEGPGAYESEDSPFVDYFVFADDSWPNNETYESWWGYKTLPKLNFEGDEDLINTIMNIAGEWVGTDWNADGWRLDVAAELGHSSTFHHDFWRLFRETVKEANPEAVILAEVYGDAAAWLQGDQWDTVMNYDAFFEPVGYYLTGLEKHSYYYRDNLHNNTDDFDRNLREKMAKLPYNSLQIAMNQLDNHDHSRFLTRTSGFVDDTRSSTDVSAPEMADQGVNKGILKEATVMQMTLPGAPTLYYGDEAGIVGFTDPDSRRTYPWGQEDEELLSFFKEIIEIHKSYSSIITGSLVTLNAKSKGMYAYGRWDKDNRIIVGINNKEKESWLEIPTWQMGLSSGDRVEMIFRTGVDFHERPNETLRIEEDKILVKIPAYGSIILASDKGAPEPEAVVTSRPEIKEVSPRPNSSKAAPGDPIVITFSEPMIQREILDTFSISPRIEGTFHWNGPVVTFIPAQPLESGTTYTLSVSANIRGRNGNFYLQEGKSWDFTVK
jgi:alpha-glucosidase